MIGLIEDFFAVTFFGTFSLYFATMFTKTAFYLEELINDRLNPILVRELRQMVRSRFVVTMLNLYIGILVVVCLSMVAFASVSQLESMGQNLFAVLSSITGLSCFFVVIIYTGTATASERINSDLMFSSALKPWQIVWGKFCSGLVLSLLLFSAVFPFFTLAYLLRGLDLATFLTTVYGIFLGIHTVNSLVIFVSSTVRSTVQSIFIGLGTFFAFFFFAQPAFYFLTYRLGLGFGGGMGLGGPSWMFFITQTLFSVSVIGFFLIAAAIVISPPSSNRMVPMRLYVSSWAILSFLYLTGLYIYSVLSTSYGYGYSDFSEMVNIWCALQVVILFIAIPFISSERDNWSFRIRNTIPRVSLFRLLVFPFYTGVACGYLWWMLYTGIVAIVFITMGEYSTSDFVEMSNIFCLLLFLPNYFFTAVLLRTTILSKKIPPGKTWAIAVIICAIMTLGTALIYSFLMMNNRSFLEGYDTNILSILNPFSMMFNFGPYSYNSGLVLQSYGALAWAAILILLGIPWFFRRFAQFTPDLTPEEREIRDAIAKERSVFPQEKLET